MPELSGGLVYNYQDISPVVTQSTGPFFPESECVRASVAEFYRHLLLLHQQIFGQDRGMHSLTRSDGRGIVIARSETTKQSRQLKAEIATLRSQ